MEETRRVSWIPTIVFGIGVLLAMTLGMFAGESRFYGLCAALLYGVSLSLAGVLEQRMAPELNAPNKSLRKYTLLTFIALVVGALWFPGWVAGEVLAFGTEGVALLRSSPRCATNKLRLWWQKLRS